MNHHHDRTFLDLKKWNPNIGKTFYEIHPTDKNQFRTYYIRWDAFANAMRSFPTPYIVGTPPDGMEAIRPLLLSQLNRMPQSTTFGSL